MSPPDARNSSIPEILDEMLDEGLGRDVRLEGDAHLTLVDGAAPPAAGPNEVLVSRFAHLADMQITDDESPARVTTLDLTVVTTSAFRPQEPYLCNMAHAMVRKLNAVHVVRPLDFVVLGGDNIDNAQTNELDWVLGILEGGTVHCDSGDDDDVVSGAGNDPKDPFDSEGLMMPWYWVTGNHDILVQGNLVVDDAQKATAIGSFAVAGTRMYSDGGWIEGAGPVVADPQRALLDADVLIDRVAASGDGHGLAALPADAIESNYVFDVPGSDLRVLVVDTAAVTGSAEGVLEQSVVDAEIIPLLDQAVIDGKYVIATSHHSALSLTDGSEFGGTDDPLPGALTPQEWVDTLTTYPNVIMLLVGHSHENRVRLLTGATGNLWEVTTPAIADFPHQSRIIEVFDADNGYLRMRVTNVDILFQDDRLARDGREMGILDMVSGWVPNGAGDDEDRNVEIWVLDPL